jgi:hypothetical protein
MYLHSGETILKKKDATCRKDQSTIHLGMIQIYAIFKKWMQGVWQV